MKKVLFLIHDLGQGGAEKVLVNLVNNMDYTKFDITVMTLFDCGENRRFLNTSIKYKTWCKYMFPGNSHLMKLFSPRMLHKMIIKEKYDIEVAYLEGPCSRIISGSPYQTTKLVSWIHIEQHTAKKAAASFRSIKEAIKYYNKFNKIVCVSKTVKNDFQKIMHINVPIEVLYNTNESKNIISRSQEIVENVDFDKSEVKLVGVGKLLKNKGFDRILKITNRLIKEGYKIHTYILGEGPERERLQKYINENNLHNQVSLLGYQLNPYKYIAKCDLFVCSSYAEGFSTAASEALILGIPVCTVEVSGMKEMLGENNEYGIVVKNDDEALYQGIKKLLDKQDLWKHYKHQAEMRGKDFSTEKTVRAVEEMFLCCVEGK